MTTAGVWQDRASDIRFDSRPLVDGIRIDPDGSDCVDLVSPRDGAVLHSLAAGTAAEAALAVAAASRSFEQGGWRSFSPMIRKSILFALAEAVEYEREGLALLDCLEMGKPVSQAMEDVTACAHIIRYYAEWADKAYGDAAPAMPTSVHYNRREPRGVVAAIVPWNYPLPNAALKIGPALAAGNSVVLKPSELSPSSALRLAEIALGVGIPPGVLNVLTGLGATVGAALAEHPDVDLIAFTGSTHTGRELMRLASCSALKALQLECGGKSANIVMADAPDTDLVAADVARRIFTNQGQLCVAGTRLIVHEDRKDEVVEGVIAAARRLRIGDPLDPGTDFGPLASRPRLNHVVEAVEHAVEGGARSLHGGERVEGLEGFFMQPTVLDGVDADMPIGRTDLFGPVLTVTPFRTVDEAIALANATDYGLSASLWTQDLRAAAILADRLKAGRVVIQAAAANPLAASAPLAAEPFGQSGIGAEGGRAGFELYTRLKAVEIHH